MKVPKFILLLVLGSLLGTRFAQADTAITDENERKEYSNVLDQVTRDYMEPAYSAERHRDYHKACELFESAADTWRKHKFRTGTLEPQRIGSMTIAMRAAAAMARDNGDFDEAARLFLQCEEECPAGIGSPSMCGAAEAFILGKHFDKAGEIYKKQIESSGKMFQDPNVNLARLYEAEGNTKLAEETLQAYLDKAVADKKVAKKRTAMQGLIDFYQRTGRPGLAKKMTETLYDKHCPVCKLDANVEPIMRRCVVSEDDPWWYCRADRTSF